MNGWRWLAGWLVVALAVVSADAAWAMDPELLKVRLIPRDEPGSTPVGPRYEVEGRLWMGEQDIAAERRQLALRVSQRYAAQHMQGWVRDTPLEALERLRRTDLKLSESTLPPALSRRIDVKLRISEEARLRMTTAEFQRDLLYDPISRKMWMDVYRFDLPFLGGPNVTFTQSYRWGTEGSQSLLRMNIPFK